MACCGRGRKPRQRPASVPKPKVAARSVPQAQTTNTCPACGGPIKLDKNLIMLGTQQVMRCKCTRCGKQHYRIMR